MRLWLCLPWILIVACAQGEAAQPAERARNGDVRSSDDDAVTDDRGGIEVVDASSGTRARASAQHDDAGQRAGPGGARASGGSGSKAERAKDAGQGTSSGDASLEQDAGVRDAGARDAGRARANSDAAPEPEPEPEPANTGSCCSASGAPGCADPALQECVCALAPRCCSDAWDESCARLVNEKNCQSGVRACVCGSGEGQWQQAYCCEGGWNATCESVSIHKCGATPACP